ncbi:MAG: pitrilysin family protein [Pseudomonadota bacterium]
MISTLRSFTFSLGIRHHLAVALAVLTIGVWILAPKPVQAMDIQVVKSTSGVEAWLVEERSVPLIAMRIAFDGGSAQDPDDKAGLANFLSTMLDEGAGSLDAATFQRLLEENAVKLSFSDSRDHFSVSLQTLTENRAKAIELLKLALTQPRFDADAVERMRKQLLSRLAFDAKNPNRVAGRVWAEKTFAGHPYARPSHGTPESVKSIQAADLEGYRKRVFARDTVKVAVVGDIDAATLKTLLDEVFGDLPERADLKPIPKAELKTGLQTVVKMPVPQSVAVFGLPGIARKDKDFMAAFVLNQILGGGGFASRLMNEVREKRGLAYSVYSYLQTLDGAAIFAGGVATKNERVAESLKVIRSELKRMADDGPTEKELANAKSYLTGSYALRFDTSSKIAQQLLGIQLEDLGLSYVDTRNKQIEAVTIEDIRRVAKRLLDIDALNVTVVGQPDGLPG